MVRDDRYRRTVLSDPESGIGEPLARPVVVQLAGNDPGVLVQAALMAICTKLPSCFSLDYFLNIVSKQTRPQPRMPLAARDGRSLRRISARKRDWPLVELIVKALVAALYILVYVKIRLCLLASATPELAVRLARAGASVDTLHARHVAARRRGKGPAELHWAGEVKRGLMERGFAHVKVLSNDNIRTQVDREADREMAWVDGVMVGEAISGNPRLFAAGANTHLRNISLEYLDLCRQHPGIASLSTVKQHIKYFFFGTLNSAAPSHYCILVPDIAPLLARGQLAQTYFSLLSRNVTPRTRSSCYRIRPS
ncbi:hypothetical protein BOTBODRAFT_640622 [Botryobasidium botryosum FD-172 SS1]|uniref:DUS-like FMN-binding domain-containing protein n=1 Tax=Botryobasidium botryosum (strain FD-172 SS1) TaxID=930990 RepID=A0A067M3Q4_BOTB1|nr:hypothetical protein BOTBODRAFT_640622 [Botryobasidium botryosum FD-172 SS1]